MHAQEARRPLRNELAVLMGFDQPYSPVSLKEMKGEIESALKDSGVALEWRIIDKSTSNETFTNLVVARFRGRCVSEPGERPRGAGALGRTHVSDGAILTFPEVDCDQIRNLLYAQLASENRIRGDWLVGRAMGRVLAHELYHILANTGAHARSGLAKAALTPADLLAGSLHFEGKQSAEMRRNALAPPRFAISAAVRSE